MLGIGAISIETKNNRIFIDAFNVYNESPKIKSNDLILFSHDDSDHFSAKKLLDNIDKKKIKIIGPPSIVFPLLSTKKINSKSLNIIFPPHLNKPITVNENGINITVFQTKHFIDWEPIHISYLFTIEDKKIYFTGDSSILDNYSSEFNKLDILIMSFIDKCFVEKKCKQDDALKRHIAEIKKINKKINSKLILGNHLLNCDWSVDSRALETIINKKHINNLRILHFNDEAIEI